MKKKLAKEFVAFTQDMIEYLELKLLGWQKEYDDNNAIVLTAQRKLAEAKRLIRDTERESIIMKHKEQ